MSRLVHPEAIQIVDLDRPFSNFAFADKMFQGSFPIRRLFSQARSRQCRTLVLEDVSPRSAIEDENTEIERLFSDYSMQGLKRLSFWKPSFTSSSDLSARSSEDCIGFALLKLDSCPSRKYFSWHIFESVIKKYEHHHNYVPCSKTFEFRAGEFLFRTSGVLYCQQNSLNKACAQVALRSICATYLENCDLTYSQINDSAFHSNEDFQPWRGLKTEQIPRVLAGLKIPYFDFDYHDNEAIGKKVPYQRLLYSGVESGAGALMAFSMSGPGASAVGHMIPFFGHTFNEDTWAAIAEGAYFNIGSVIKYIPSDSWLSSFIVHDDNFGSNLCIPKAYLQRENAKYVIVLLPKGFQYNALYAEVAASDYFYSLVPNLVTLSNSWLNRLIDYCTQQKLILRVVPVTKQSYLDHLKNSSDWEGHCENEAILAHLEAIKPDLMWMIEVSIPDLFSTNKRKIGELLLDATLPFSSEVDFTLFVLARFPGIYLFLEGLENNGEPQFLTVPSEIISHIELLVRS